MQTKLFVLSSVFFLILSSCATRLPSLKNPDNGIAAIPLEVTNTSTGVFARYYEIIDERRPEMSIKIYPQTGQAFVFSGEVPAGEYYFSKIKHIIKPEYQSQDSVYEQSIVVPVVIKPGSVTIINEKLVVKQYQASVNFSDRSVSCRCYFQELTDSELQSFVAKFKETYGDSEWKITNEF